MKTIPIAMNLYRGSMWNAAINAFNRINGQKQLWIISCGLGFINGNDLIPGYAATFKLYKDDSIYQNNFFSNANNIQVSKDWWDLIISNPLIKHNHYSSIHDLINNSGPNDQVIISAGSNYLDAIYNDLDQVNTSNQSPMLAILGVKRLGGLNVDPVIPQHLYNYIISYDSQSRLLSLLNDSDLNGCNATQIHNKSAELLIRHYYNNGNFANFNLP